MTTGIDDVLDRMQSVLGPLHRARSPLRHFLEAYHRVTSAVGEAVGDARFEDPAWIVEWDIILADAYLAALRAHQEGTERLPRPWRVAFAAEASLPVRRHLALGVGAHLNYDLPRALVQAIADPEFADPAVMARRRRDHERLDEVLVARLGAADSDLMAVHGARRVRDLLLAPMNRRLGSSVLRDMRRKTWHNALELQRARQSGAERYARRLAELEVLSAAKVAELLPPGPILLRASTGGLGVVLPPE